MYALNFAHETGTMRFFPELCLFLFLTTRMEREETSSFHTTQSLIHSGSAILTTLGINAAASLCFELFVLNSYMRLLSYSIAYTSNIWMKKQVIWT